MCKFSDQTKETLSGIFCEYKSIRFIRIRNVRLSIIYWVTMLIVLMYVIVFTIYWDKGYQDTAEVTGTTSIKLKGSGSIGNDNGPIQDLTPLDAMDLVQPSMEENAFFIITAITATPNQTRQLNCAGNKDVPECTANATDACNEHLYSPDSQGIFTGNCSANGRCEMYSWCPLENDTNPDLVNNVGAFTAFVKIDVNYELFGIDRNNIYDKYGSAPTFGYNLFTVNDMLSDATDGEITSVDQVARFGAIILVASIWNCDFDKNVNECNPEFSFKRIDGHAGTISDGYNFRTVTYDTNEEKRYLRKLYGVRFIFVTEGVGGQFSFFAMTITFGAGLAYLGVSALIADIVLERFLPESQSYVEAKHKDLLDSGTVSLVEATSICDNAYGGTDGHYHKI